MSTKTESNDYLSATEWCPLDRSLILYGRDLSRMLQFCAFIHSLVWSTFGQIECHHNSIIRDEFVSEMCSQAPDRFVMQKPFMADPSYHGNIFPSSNFGYYPWVSFALFGQGLVCKLLWSWFERNNWRRLHLLTQFKWILWKRIERPAGESRRPGILSRPRHRLFSLLEMLANDVAPYYPFQYGLILFGSLSTIILQLVLLQKFLSGRFIFMGMELFTNITKNGWWLTITKFFPNVIQCQVNCSYGSSGNVQQLNSLCTLNHNPINGYIFSIIWYLYLILAITIIFAIIRLISIIFFIKFIKYYLEQKNRLYEALQRVNFNHYKKIDSIYSLLLIIGINPDNLCSLMEEFGQRRSNLSVRFSQIDQVSIE